MKAHAVVDFNDRAIGRSHLSLKIGGQKEPPARGGHPPKLPDRLVRRREQVEHVGGDNRVKAAVRVRQGGQVPAGKVQVGQPPAAGLSLCPFQHGLRQVRAENKARPLRRRQGKQPRSGGAVQHPGPGKSTLLHMMGGLDTPTSGSVVVRDKELAKMNDEQLTIFRRRNIGFVFQNYNLVPILNVYENIVLPVELDGDTVDQKFMDEVVKMLGLQDKLQNMPNNLSGGQQQRVAIARALVSKPAIVLADEPTGNLDSKTSADVLGLLQRTSREFNQTLVMITHNNEIAQLADRIVRIEDGKIKA